MTTPTTPVPMVPGQARRAAADDANELADGEELMPGTNDNELADGEEPIPGTNDNELADGEEPMPGTNDNELADGEELMPGTSDNEPPAYGGTDEELPPPRATGRDEPLLSRTDDNEPPAYGGADGEPLLPGIEELRAGWQRARTGFVDNPRGAVAEAAGLADEAAEALAAALRERRQRIRDTWDGNGPTRDTEAMRVALLRYQALFNKIVGD